MKRLLTIPGLALLLIVLPWIALGATWQWAEGSGNEDGATRDFFNLGASLEWNTFMGDWVDQAGTPYGLVPFATAPIVDDDTNQTLSFDLTGLANEWLSGARLNNGILLTSDRGGPFNFRSREYADAAERPKLELTVDGQLQTLDAQADTNLSKSTYKSQGTNDFFRLRHNATTQNETPLLRFDLSTFEGKTVTSATLKIVSYVQYGGGQATVNVFSVPAQLASDSPVANGIAAQYDSDRGIAAHPDVYFATDFEETDGPWTADWTRANGFVDLASPTDTSYGFSPFSGKALRTRFETADNYGMDVSYEFMDKQLSEPDDVFFRYYLRLGDDWNQTVDGGKLPGIAGRYGRAGWGGRKPSATDPTKFGWSARGYYAKTIPAGGNPLGGTTPIGNYIYHLDQGSQFGENNLWTVDQKGYIQTDRWYCIEQYVKMNTVGQADGIYLAWVDGQLAFERSDFRFRSVDTLHIEEIWMNFYHGGTAKSPYDQHAYLDHVVISKSYIGPLVFKTFGTWLPSYDHSAWFAAVSGIETVLPSTTITWRPSKPSVRSGWRSACRTVEWSSERTVSKGSRALAWQ